MTRRSKSTDFLKECIADAMIKLMEEKPLEKITAQEITDLAGVGRATFFRQFSSKGEVLLFKLIMLWNRWAKEHGLSDKSKFSLLTSESLFEFNLQIRPLITKLYEENMQSVIYEAFYEEMKPQFGTNPVQCYANRFYSYGTFGLIDEWVKRGFKETPKEMADILVNSIVGENVSLSQ